MNPRQGTCEHGCGAGLGQGISLPPGHGLPRLGDTLPVPVRASLLLTVALVANATELLCMQEKYLVTGSFLCCGFL